MPKGRFAWSTRPGARVSGCDPDAPKPDSDALSETFAPSHSYKKTIVSKQVSNAPFSFRFRSDFFAYRSIRRGVDAPRRRQAPGPPVGTSILPARGTDCVSRVSGCTAPTDCDEPAALSGQRRTFLDDQHALLFPDTGPTMHAIPRLRPGSAKSRSAALPFRAQNRQNAWSGFATGCHRAEGMPGSRYQGTGWI